MSLGPDPDARTGAPADPSALDPPEDPAERDPAEVVADAVLDCPVVAALADDGLVATFLPGRRVHGITLADEVCTVAVVLRWDGETPLPELAELVRRAAAPAAGERRVDVVVAGLLEPSETEPSETEPAAP